MFNFRKTEVKETPQIIPYKVLEPGEYPICKSNASLDTINPPAIMQTCAFQIANKGLDVLRHRERLFKAQDKINPWFTYNQVKELQNAGFKWFVLSDFIKQFKYHASLSSRYSEVSQHLNTSYKDVLYAGDIPDFALAQIEKAKDTKLTLFRNIYDETRWDGIEYITIHSMQPMPVELVISDPVVIGWRWGIGAWLNKEGTLDSYDRGIMGVIITAWDIEGELR